VLDLIIDPQGQASTIRNIEPDLLVLRTKEKAFVRLLENAVTFGRRCLSRASARSSIRCSTRS
jgi:hypothetical protein